MTKNPNPHPAKTTVEQHTETVLGLAKPLSPKLLPLDECLNLILAQPLVAKLAVPPFSNSAMDGFAVMAADLADASETNPVVLPVSGDVPAGAWPNPLTKGTAQRIMTGAPIPDGVDAVVQVELTDQPAGPADLPSEVKIYASVPLGSNIRRRGENVSVGDLITPEGTRLTPAALAAAASVGYGELLVHPRPRVAVVSTGSELAAAGEPLSAGQIPDSNQVMLAGLVSDYGSEVVFQSRGIDSPEGVTQLLLEAASRADLVLTSGGVSAGAYDVIKQIGDIGQLSFDKICQQPGKPQGFGFINAPDGRQVPILAFPGNPTGAFLSFHLYARPLLAKLAGDDPSSVLFEVDGFKAATSWPSPAGRRQYTPVVTDWETEDGIPQITPVHQLHSGSHLIGSLFLADAFAISPEDVCGTEAGEMMKVLPIVKDVR